MKTCRRRLVANHLLNYTLILFTLCSDSTFTVGLLYSLRVGGVKRHNTYVWQPAVSLMLVAVQCYCGLRHRAAAAPRPANSTNATTAAAAATAAADSIGVGISQCYAAPKRRQPPPPQEADSSANDVALTALDVTSVHLTM